MTNTSAPFEEYLRKKKVELLETKFREQAAEQAAEGAEDDAVDDFVPPSTDDPVLEARVKDEAEDFFESGKDAGAELFSKADTRLGDSKVEEIRDELRDRFGALPSPVENLLYLVDLKLLAGETEAKSITQSGSTVTITLLEPVGGARLPLEKALGPLARVGNQQVRVNLREAGDRWEDSLVTILERLKGFTGQLAAVAAAV